MLERFKNSHILLDTNLLIYSAKSLESFADFYKELKDNNIEPLIDSAIKLEFLRSSNTLDAYSKKLNFLNLLVGDEKDRTELSVSTKVFEDAQHISMLYYYSNAANKGISSIDCIIAAQLKQYEKKLLLATVNNKDFPTKILDRVEVFCVDTDNEIYSIGIYKFSNEKYKRVASRFINSVK